MDIKRIEEIRDRYKHYPEKLDKNTAVAHIRELLAELDKIRSI